MPTKIFLETLSDPDDDDGHQMVTLETFIALFVHQHLKAPPDRLQVYLVRSQNSTDCSIRIDLTDIPHQTMTSLEYKTELANLCNFPVLMTNQRVIIAGLCGVCRGMVKHSGQDTTLLGFKGACLLAPAEMSVWTKFCEIDVVESTKSIVAMCTDGSFGRTDEMNQLECTLPDTFGRFESHMGQPVRMHNVYKLARNMAKGSTTADVTEDLSSALSALNLTRSVKEPRLNKTKKKKTVHISSATPIKDLNLEHRFVEGPDNPTLADCIIYACYAICLDALPAVEQLLQHHLPLTGQWWSHVDALLNIRARIRFNLNAAIASNKLKTIFYNVTVPTAYSLYKNDSKRYKPQSQIFTKQTDIDGALAKINQLSLNITSDDDLRRLQPAVTFDWTTLPYDALPEGGNLPADRLERKKHQLQSLAAAVLAIARPKARIVDFCSGAGHLGIIIAVKRPDCEVLLLENKEESLMRAKARVDQMQLSNVRFFQCNLDYFRGSFDVGTSLHACGVATDIVLSHCQRERAQFVCCPCCYGGIRAMPHISYPRSGHFRRVVSEQDCMHVAHCADQSHDVTKAGVNVTKSVQGQYCMDVVDWDRKLAAEELGYQVQLTRLQPENCTPKNRLLIGRFAGKKDVGQIEL